MGQYIEHLNLVNGLVVDASVAFAPISMPDDPEEYIPILPSFNGDVTGCLLLTISPHAVTNAKIRQSVANSIIGNPFNSTGDVQDIQCAATGLYLHITGTTLGFSAIPAADLPALNGLTAPTGDVSLNSHKITSLTDPTAAQDAATKNYVDTTESGLSVRASCRLATTGILPNSPTYSNGVSGLGATLTANTTGALTIDGVAVAINDRVLVKNEVAGYSNGIYTVSTLGTVSVPYQLTRAIDFNLAAKITEGAFTLIEEGTANAQTLWMQTAAGPVVLGAGGTNLAFAELKVAVFTAAGASHAPGSVPDPGATANTLPKVLLDNGTWGWKAGDVLGSFYTANSETTTSTTFTDLTTADSVTFTLDAAANVIVLYMATQQATAGAPGTMSSQVNYDGTLDTTSLQQQGITAANVTFSGSFGHKKASLGAGSHTIKVQHKVQTGLTGNWLDRTLLVLRDN